MQRLKTFTALIVLGAAALTNCGDQQGTEIDGFGGGTLELALHAAPGSLCLGNGSERECEPGKDCSAPSGSNAGFQANGGSAPQAAGPQGQAGVGFTPPNSGVGQGGAVSAAGSFNGSAGLTAGGGSGGSAGLTAGGSAGDGGSAGACANGECTADAGSSCEGGDGGVCDELTDSVIGTSRQALNAGQSCNGLEQDTPATLYESADDSNSMASPVIARSLIRRGQRVPAHIVRSYEFLNYYDFSFEPALPGEVRLVPQLSSCPDQGQLSLQVALQSEARSSDQRAPINLTLVLDTSGSMEGAPIANLRASVRAIASVLRAGDVMSMVTWNTAQLDVLVGHEVTGPGDPVVVAAAQAMNANGGTDLHAGLTRGYELAVAQRAPGRINGVLLISDGMANVGVTDVQTIAQHANDEEFEGGIYLAGIGVGDGVNDTLMNAVTDAGRGAYLFIDSEREAERMLSTRFLEVVDIAARAVRLEVTLPWYMKVEKFYGEQISTDPTLVRPQHLAPNSAMVFFQVLQACSGAEIHWDDRIRLRATWQTPFTREHKETVLDTTLNALAGEDQLLEKGAAIAGYAEALVASATLSGAERTAVLQRALGDVVQAPDAARDPDLIEIKSLLEAYLAVPL